jgi:indole-3-glycerol phosphate synthase
MSLEPVADLLGTIVAATRRTLESREARLSMSALTRQAEAREARPGIFRSALTRSDRFSIIAECKRRSPAKGVLRVDYEPAAVAAGYAAAGAAAISVLTEPSFFDGSLAHLEAVRAAVTVPILRKDFIVSEYQLLEARAAGADAVLLIVAALTAAGLTRLLASATDLGLGVLVEVHSAEELAVAVGAGATIIGVNNRNLRTLAVDLNASESLIASMPKDAVAVSESGLRRVDDLRRLRGLGYGAFLIGERFMTDADPGAALAQMLAAAAALQRDVVVTAVEADAEETLKEVRST